MQDLILLFCFLLGGVNCSYAQKTYSKFDFFEKEGIIGNVESFYFDIEKEDEKIVSISRFDLDNSKYNYKIKLTRNTENWEIYEVILYEDKSHSSFGSYPLEGYLLINKNSENIYYLYYGIEWMSSTNNNIGNVKSIYQLDKNLYPINKITFSDKNAAIWSEFHYSESKFVTKEVLSVFDLSHLISKPYTTCSYDILNTLFAEKPYGIGKYLMTTMPNFKDRSVPSWMYFYDYDN